MSSEDTTSTAFITPSTGPLPSLPGPSTGSWATHTTSGDVEGSFPNMDVDADLDRVACIESLCMNCKESGMTRLLLTKIPYFREVVIMSFECPHCHYRNSEIQPANEIQPKACRVALKVSGSNNPSETEVDLRRQVIKSETCRIEIPELEFEIPPNPQRGDINTLEGILSNIADSLSVDQPNRELSEPEAAAKIQVIVDAIREMAEGEREFTFILDDLAGNSFLENPNAPQRDAERVTLTYYERTAEQSLELGYAVEENKSANEALPVIRGEAARQKLLEMYPEKADQLGAKSSSSSSGAPQHEARGVPVSEASMKSLDTYFNVSDRSAILHGPCTACPNPEAETRMCVTEIPHFKDCVLLVTLCDQCGFRDSEVKPMGTVSSLGRRITLKVTSLDDLKRDLLKSDTASIEIPELELELMPGTLGGKYSTLEGIICDIRDQLTRANPFALGDSAQDENNAMTSFVTKVNELLEMKQSWTFILDCPLGNCFIFSDDPTTDPSLTIERYERTFEQNEDLGLNDMNVDHYLPEDEQKEFDRRVAEEAKQAAEAKAASGNTEEEVDEAVTSQLRQIELKKSKIGGLISVDHPEDD